MPHLFPCRPFCELFLLITFFFQTAGLALCFSFSHFRRAKLAFDTPIVLGLSFSLLAALCPTFPPFDFFFFTTFGAGLCSFPSPPIELCAKFFFLVILSFLFFSSFLSDCLSDLQTALLPTSPFEPFISFHLCAFLFHNRTSALAKARQIGR